MRSVVLRAVKQLHSQSDQQSCGINEGSERARMTRSQAGKRLSVGAWL